ncbi:ABC transporter, ATP-binding protein (cluster 11, riboflavin/purine nucleoside/unknown) / ABC transporter, ATP-binding protein (cluster 11, riboflavin/purine nucleoside/unknown) [hydrothermal vent metagenome]|uniref:ABC transporter domain-containing protein n=1 Tax=hydrothermal vent metagenome TaxID=652676 RepID=A0A3B0RC37_9ZZZZ
MADLHIKGVTKRFGSLTANDNVSLRVAGGEVVALLGENGAGKTTLMNILFGHYVADEGSVEIDGNTLPPGSTDAAIKAGVGMVHQHFTLAENLSVLDNIMLGTESLFALTSKVGAARKKLRRLATEYNLEVDPDALVGALSVGERQRVEILKVLYRGAKILILDEPTAVLTPAETDQLFINLKNMVAKGMSIIFISHKLHEILAISDRVTVLRHGAVVGEVETKNADRAMLAEMMVGRKVTRPKAETMQPGATVVELQNITVNASKGMPALLDNASLTVRRNEIVAIAGVAGNGQRELAELLSGVRPPDSGSILVEGQTVTKHNPRQFLQMGFGRIPEDRHHTGTVGEMSVWENLISEKLRQSPLWRYGWIIDFAACRAKAGELMKQFDIRCNGMEMQARLLSGGNMQKLILARTLTADPKFILANQPVRGLDEGAIAFVHEQLLKARTDGAGILLISEDLDEIFSIADQVAVIYHGAISPLLNVRETNIGQIGAMMGGDMQAVA